MFACFVENERGMTLISNAKSHQLVVLYHTVPSNIVVESELGLVDAWRLLYFILVLQYCRFFESSNSTSACFRIGR